MTEKTSSVSLASILIENTNKRKKVKSPPKLIEVFKFNMLKEMSS